MQSLSNHLCDLAASTHIEVPLLHRFRQKWPCGTFQSAGAKCARQAKASNCTVFSLLYRRQSIGFTQVCNPATSVTLPKKASQFFISPAGHLRLQPVQPRTCWIGSVMAGQIQRPVRAEAIKECLLLAK